MKNLVLRLALSLSALALSACGGAAYHMRTSVEASPPDAIDGRAVVVFAMPNDGREVISIADELGVILGELRGHTWFAKDVAPGDHRFYAFAGSSAYVVHATALEAGRVYYVEMIDPLLGNHRFVSRGCVAATIGTASRTTLDTVSDEEVLRRQVGNLPQRVREADEEMARLSATEQAARTLTGSCQ